MDTAAADRGNNANGKRFILSAEALEAITAELDELRSTGRSEIAQRMREARSFGDGVESGESFAVSADASLLEARIARLEELVANARVVDSGVRGRGTVGVGSRVRVKDAATGRVADYRVVPFDGTALSNGTVSVSSPVGQALMGARAGDLVRVELPSGRHNTLRVLAVSRR
ncbi:MAG TPA: GreA/GreB family elongation factor [Thermoleophilaceae bacterium]